MFGVLKRRPLVSVCIPAYRAEAFINETVQSVLDQTVQDFEIVISNDAGHVTHSLNALKKHPKIRVLTPRRRLGWVDNSNAALAHARGHHAMILPHDDRLAPTYIARCLEVLEQDAQAFAAVSDIDTDLLKRPMIASEVCGELPERIEHVMRNLYRGFTYRALMRWKPGYAKRLALIHNPPHDAFVDTTWIMQQACLGALRRVPEPLYFKRYHANNTHTGWWELPAPDLLQAWQVHCRQMHIIAAPHMPNKAKLDQLLDLRLDARRVHEAPPEVKRLITTPRLT